MDATRFDRLNNRHRECLRLYAQRYSTAEIARIIGISENTANSYLTEAARLLDAGGRPGAAAALAQYEADHLESRGRFSAGDAPPPPPSTSDPAKAEEARGPTKTWTALLPLRLGARNNELSIVARLAWIPFIALLFASGFGMFAQGIRIISDLVRGTLH